MDLKTNVVVKGKKTRVVYETIITPSKNAVSNAEKRKLSLEEFSKKLNAAKK